MVVYIQMQFLMLIKNKLKAETEFKPCKKPWKWIFVQFYNEHKKSYIHLDKH